MSIFPCIPPPAPNRSPVLPSPNPGLIYLIIILNITEYWTHVLFKYVAHSIQTPTILCLFFRFWETFLGPSSGCIDVTALNQELVIFCGFTAFPCTSNYTGRILWTVQHRRENGVETLDVLIRTSVHLWAVCSRRWYWKTVVCHSCPHMGVVSSCEYVCSRIVCVRGRTWVCMCVYLSEWEQVARETPAHRVFE